MASSPWNRGIYSMAIKSIQQSALSRVATPRAQFIKAADYDPAFRSCTQSGHRVVGASGHRKKKPSASMSQTSADSKQLSEQSVESCDLGGPRLIAERNLKFPESIQPATILVQKECSNMGV